MRLPKPSKREPAKRKRIARRVRIARVSAKRGQVIKADREWAEKVRKRSPKLCEYCGRHFGSTPMTTPECHHLYTKGSDPKLRHVLANGIHLHWFCHHVTAHSDMDGFRAWFSEAYPERWKALEKARLA